MEAETWQKAVALNGLLTVGGYDDDVERLVDRSVETQTAAGQFSYGSLDPKSWRDDYKSQTDPAALGYPVLEFYDRTSDERYLEAAERASTTTWPKRRSGRPRAASATTAARWSCGSTRSTCSRRSWPGTGRSQTNRTRSTTRRSAVSRPDEVPP